MGCHWGAILARRPVLGERRSVRRTHDTKARKGPWWKGAIYVPLAVVSGLYGAASGVLARVAAQGLQEILPGG